MEGLSKGGTLSPRFLTCSVHHSLALPLSTSLPKKGSLLFYDFGMMGDIVPGVKDKLLDVFYGIYRKDTTQVIR